jgi:hypothetical protein
LSSPWFLGWPQFSSHSSFQGGWKIEFQELERAAERADQAGLLAPRREATVQDYAFQRIADDDPNLALAGLRIEIEKRLVAIAERSGLEVRGRGIGQLLRLLGENQILRVQERSVLADLIGLLNSAVHGAEIDRRSATWAMEIGPRLLAALDDLGPK